MTAAAFEIPEPADDDPESVATALETAAIFGAQGDAREALRWVRRAAELASDDGNDARALNLARSAADISGHLSSAPPPPPVTSSAPPALVSQAASVGGSVAAPPPPPPPLPPPGRAAAPASMPPTDYGKLPDLGVRPSVAAAAANGGPIIPSPAIVPPPAFVPQPAFVAPLDPSEPEAETTEPRASQVPFNGQRAAAGAPAPAAIETPLYQQPVQYEPPQYAPQPESHMEPVPHPEAVVRPSARHAARVSIEPSTEEGVFVVQLLRDGEAVPIGAYEALVVLTDPTATLFTTS